MSRSEGEQEIMSKLNISKEMHEVFAKLNHFLDNLFRDASNEDDYPKKKRKKYLIKSNSNDTEINENVQNILKDFLDNPQIEQKIFVEDQATKDKLLANTNKFLENLSEENILKLQDYYLKDELPQLYVEANISKQNDTGQKFSIDLMRKNVKEFLDKHSLTLAAAREKANDNKNESPAPKKPS